MSAIELRERERPIPSLLNRPSPLYLGSEKGLKHFKKSDVLFSFNPANYRVFGEDESIYFISQNTNGINAEFGVVIADFSII